MRRVLVTGVARFTGGHLVDYLLVRGDRVIFGIHHWRCGIENTEHLAASGFQMLERALLSFAREAGEELVVTARAPGVSR